MKDTCVCPYCRERQICARKINSLLANIDRSLMIGPWKILTQDEKTGLLQKLDVYTLAEQHVVSKTFLFQFFYQILIFQTDIELIKMLLELLKLLDSHRIDNKRVKDHQRDTRADHPLDLLVYIWDFKGSIKVGVGNEATSEEERQASMVSINSKNFQLTLIFLSFLFRFHILT